MSVGSPRAVRLPRHLAQSAAGVDAPSGLRGWLESLPNVVASVAADWRLEVGEPYEPGGRSAWVAPVVRGHDALVLKVAFRHFEAEHEPDGLRAWEGDGAIRCLSSRAFEATTACLLERCEPGNQLSSSVGEEGQDVVIASLLRRLWSHRPSDDSPFRPLEALCAYWADSLEGKLETMRQDLDRGVVRAALDVLRELPASAEERVLLCTDLHAENVLSARREPWLVIDPKPFLGDAAFDPAQHMLNCQRRLTRDPGAMADRLASLLDLAPERVRLWLFARCAQEGVHDRTMRRAARRLAP